MRKHALAFISVGLLASILALGGLGIALAQTPGLHTPFGRDYGPGMMGGYGSGYGPGGMMRWGWGRTGTTLNSIADARTAFQSYLDQTGDADLRLDEILQFAQNFYAEVKENSTGTGAYELLADRRTGHVFPEFGPNMMWNTKYGHMAGWLQPETSPALTTDQAQAAAQQWLDANQPGSTTEAPDAYYGYFTIHILRDGKVTGMLSVNASSGQVWYHTWHGSFIASSETSG